MELKVEQLIYESLATYEVFGFAGVFSADHLLTYMQIRETIIIIFNFDIDGFKTS